MSLSGLLTEAKRRRGLKALLDEAKRKHVSEGGSIEESRQGRAQQVLRELRRRHLEEVQAEDDQRHPLLAQIRVTHHGYRIKVASPYNKVFVATARNLGGKWDAGSKTWAFDVRDEARVREALRATYGTDGEVPPDVVTIRVRLGSRFRLGKSTPIVDATGQEVFVAGRRIARRAGRDWRVALGDGVVVVEGAFPASAGSRRNPGVMDTGVVVVEVRDVARALADAEVAEHPGAIEIVDR